LCLFGFFFFGNSTPWQYITIQIVIMLSCIAIYRNTLYLRYRDTPTLKWRMNKLYNDMYMQCKNIPVNIKQVVLEQRFFTWQQLVQDNRISRIMMVNNKNKVSNLYFVIFASQMSVSILYFVIFASQMSNLLSVMERWEC
jgi:hypothetical protein